MEKETLKSLRAKAKDLRSKVSSAPLSRATPDQLRSEILMLERAVKAEEKAKEKRALKVSMEAEKKKTTKVPVMAPADQREKELAKRERELAKREKMLMAQRTTLPQSDSDD